MAVSRPSMRRARSMTTSDSTSPCATAPVLLPPWPGSSTTVRPARLCPERRTSSRSRRTLAEPPDDRAAQVVEGPQRVGTDRAVAGQAVGALEAAHGPLGLGPEPAVDPPGGEAQGVEPLLQR